MERRKETVQVIGELIGSWQLPIKIKAVVDNGNGTYLLSVDKTYYLQSGKRRKITINLVEYIVLEVVNNSTLTVKNVPQSAIVPIVGTIILPPPFYFNGTILQTNTELNETAEIWNKTPMIYLKRPFEETLDAKNLIDTDVANRASLTLMFLTEANFAEWSTADHDKHAIVPMRNMLYEFIEMLKLNEKYIQRFTDYSVTDLIKFGLVTQKGVEGGGLFSDNYSGVQLDIVLGIKYQCFCN